MAALTPAVAIAGAVAVGGAHARRPTSRSRRPPPRRRRRRLCDHDRRCRRRHDVFHPTAHEQRVMRLAQRSTPPAPPCRRCLERAVEQPCGRTARRGARPRPTMTSLSPRAPASSAQSLVLVPRILSSVAAVSTTVQDFCSRPAADRSSSSGLVARSGDIAGVFSALGQLHWVMWGGLVLCGVGGGLWSVGWVFAVSLRAGRASTGAARGVRRGDESAAARVLLRADDNDARPAETRCRR